MVTTSYEDDGGSAKRKSDAWAELRVTLKSVDDLKKLSNTNAVGFCRQNSFTHRGERVLPAQTDGVVCSICNNKFHRDQEESASETTWRHDDKDNATLTCITFSFQLLSFLHRHLEGRTPTIAANDLELHSGVLLAMT